MADEPSTELDSLAGEIRREHEAVVAGVRATVEAAIRCGSLAEWGLAVATIARRLSGLNAFMEYAVDEGLIERNPMARLRRPRAVRDGHLTPWLDRGIQLRPSADLCAERGANSIRGNWRDLVL